MQCFVFVEKIVSTVLPFFENNIYKVLNIYQMIQICQGFQPNFKSFMKSLVGYISDKLADENVTGRDFSTFFTWPLSHKPLCVSIWNSHPAILNVLIQFRSSCYQEINIQKKKFLFPGNIYFQWRDHVFWLQLQTYFPSLHLLKSQLSALLTNYPSKINFNLVVLC